MYKSRGLNQEVKNKYRGGEVQFFDVETERLVFIIIIFGAHQHKAAGLKIKLSKIKWLQRRFIRWP